MEKQKQILVHFSEDMRAEVCTYLRSRGLSGPSAAEPKPVNTVNVFCVDRAHGEYYPVNAMICAARAQAGLKTVSFEELRLSV